MERFNRMLQAAQGMGMGNAAPGAVSYDRVVSHLSKSEIPLQLSAFCMFLLRTQRFSRDSSEVFKS